MGRKLGQGAFGQVFEGKWGERKVALKKIDIQYAKKSLYRALDVLNKEEQIIEALQWEVSRLSTVSHPNCVQFYGIYQHEDQGHTYVVMEFCDRGTLFDVLFDLEDKKWSKRWQWALEMTQGLFYLHEKGIMHRDLKAENVLIDQNGCAKLSDLGVARVDVLLCDKEPSVVSKGLQDKRFIATENFLDPMLSNPSTDIYSLGLVFWQMSKGKKEPRNPFDMSQEEREDWCQGKIIEREVIPPNCPNSFKSLILSCWIHKPLKCPTVSDIVKELHLMGTQFNPQPTLVQSCEQLSHIIHPNRSEGL